MKKRYVVAISGLPRSGSTSAGKALAREMDLNFLDAGQIFKDISQGRFTQRQYEDRFKEICRHKGISYQVNICADRQCDAALGLWNMQLGRDPRFHDAIDTLQIEKAKEGGYVIVGKLAIYLTQQYADMKVWFEIPLEERAIRASKSGLIRKEEAQSLIEERQNRERKEWNEMSGRDYWGQKKLADLVIDNPKLTTDQAVKLMLEKFNYLTGRQ